MIKITLFEVGRGASVLIELPSEQSNGIPVGIIDCFEGLSGINPLLQHLAELEQRTCKNIIIEFLVITHLHSDHFMGVGELLKRYGPQISRYADPGIDVNGIILSQYPTSTRSDSRARHEIRQIENFKRQYPSKIAAITTPNTVIYQMGDHTNGVTVRSVAPDGIMLMEFSSKLVNWLRRSRARYRRNPNTYNHKGPSKKWYDLNRTSSAIELVYQGHRVVFGGDVLSRTWNLVLLQMELRVDAFMLSHHGSNTGHPKKQWHSKIHKSGSHALVSGKGTYQPCESVVSHLSNMGTIVWVTNVPNYRHHSEILLEYVTRVHYGVLSVKHMQYTGNILLSIDNDLRIEGPKLEPVTR